MLRGWNRIFGMTAFAVVVTFLLHSVMEWAVHSYVTGVEITEGLLSAMIAGILVFYICLVAHWREVRFQQRLEAIASLNHHVRNALQTVVAFAEGHVPAPGKELNDAIARIEWVLRDVEPHLMQHETEDQWKQTVTRLLKI